MPPRFDGLDLLATAVVLVDAQLMIRYANPAAENLFAASMRQWVGQPLQRLLGDSAGLTAALENALSNNWSHTGHNLAISHGHDECIHVDCTVTPIPADSDVRENGECLLLEFRPIDQQLKAAREEQLAQAQQASRELVRNLAHEIKNPLGGIRGSAQLLAKELASAHLREYTDVIIGEADRLQELMRRLLSSHRAMQPARLNIHEILEHVRRLISAEFPGITIRRDYDSSLPELTGDREHLLQAVLNIVRNAAQAIRLEDGVITLRTRAARQVTLAKKRHRLALELQVIDNGPGIPEALRETIFYPLVSGRENGSGLGLSLAQSFILQHGGVIEARSTPGETRFTLILPLQATSPSENTP